MRVMVGGLRFPGILFVFSLLAACAGTPDGARGPTPLKGAESGAKLAWALSASDLDELHRVTGQVASSSSSAPNLKWRNNQTGTKGRVKGGAVLLVGFNSGEEIEAPMYLDTRVALEPIAGSYATPSNTNVRLAPSLKGARALMLAKNTQVRALARTPERDWVLVAQKEKVIGFIFASLLTKVGGGDLLLSGGGAKQPELCRELTYDITLNSGRTDAWVNGACKTNGSGWKIVGGRSLKID